MKSIVLGTTEDRLIRLERMVVRALLCIPSDSNTVGNGAISRECFIPEAQVVLRNHFAEYSPGDDFNERTWIEDAILLLLRKEISAEREYRKAEADEASRAAQEEINALFA